MKKYLLYILLSFLVAGPVFSQGPSFEIAPYPEPDITNINISQIGEMVRITAVATDVSGIHTVVAIIRDSQKKELERVVLYDDGAHEDGGTGDNLYGGILSTAGYSDGIYTVDIFAVDKIGFRRDLTDVGSFTIGGDRPPNCLINVPHFAYEGEIISISVGASSDDRGIVKVRFASDDSQDGFLTRMWTDWFDWDVSLGDWDATSKTKSWIFPFEGPQEVWVELMDNNDQSSYCYDNIIIRTSAINCDITPEGYIVCVDITALGDATKIDPFTAPASAVAGSQIPLSATLKYENGTPIANETIFFTDTTAGGTVGDSSIVGSWPLNEGEGCQANDQSVNANHGTLKPSCPSNAPTWVDGKFNKALSFDGSDDYIEVPNNFSLNPSSEITITAWVKLNVAKANWAPISHKGDSPRAWWFGFYPGSTTRIHWSNESLTTWSLDFDIPSALNTWRMITVTYKNGVGRKGYVGDTLVASDTASGILPASTASVVFARRPGSWDPLNGFLDEVRIYNRALTQTEISDLYNYGGTTYSAITNSSGVATINYSIPLGTIIGDHVLKASYMGNPQKSLLPSDKTATINVTQISTQIDPFTVPSSATAGSQVSLSATLKYDSGTPISGETISFRDETDNITIGSATTNSSGVATINYQVSFGASIGTHTLKANYLGSFPKSTLPSEKTATVDISGDATQINPFTVPSETQAGTTVSLSATLKYDESGLPIIGETVSFRDETDNITIGSATTNASGAATINYSIPLTATIGSHTLKVSYLGNVQQDLLPSEKTAAMNVTKIPTQIDPFTAPSSATAGSSVSLSATLKYESGTPISGETISFRDETSGTNIGSAVTNASGIATINYKISLGATVGNHTLKASYAGNTQKATLASEKTATMNVTSIGDCNTYNGSTLCVDISASLGGNTEINPFTAPASATAGSQVSLSATLKYESGTPISGETISFRDETDNVAIGSAITNTSGVATINYTIGLGAIVGSHTLKASYAGNAQKSTLASDKTTTMIVTSFGNCVKTNNYTICVEISTKGNPTKIDPFTAPAQATVNSTVSLSATLKYESSGNPISGETISFRDETSGTNIGSAVTNASGVATINYSIPLTTSIGNHNLKASYLGDVQKDLLPSEKTATINITEIPTQIDPFTAPASATAGSEVSLSATLKYESGTPIAEETISFKDETDNVAIGSAITNSSGVAQINYSIPLTASIGNHNLKASYLGDVQKDLLPSEKTATINITEISTTVDETHITPLEPATDDTLICNFTIYDPDEGDVLTADVTWEKSVDGGESWIYWIEDDETDIPVENGMPASTSFQGNIESEKLSLNEQWKCIVTGKDNYGNTDTKKSDAVSIRVYAWSENGGWLNFGSADGNVGIADTELTGYVWGENIGWISLNCSNTNTCGDNNYKVANDGEGNLSGYAWSENGGWLNFNPTHSQVAIDSKGNFSGYAWGENIGWISLTF